MSGCQPPLTLTFVAGRLAWSLGTANECYYRAVTLKGEMRQGQAMLPQPKPSLGYQSTPWPSHADYYNTAPWRCFTPAFSAPLQGPSQGWEGHDCAMYITPTTEQGPASPPNADLPGNPHPTLHNNLLPGTGGKGEAQGRPARKASAAAVNRRSRRAPWDAGKEGVRRARGLLLTKVEAIIGRVGPAPLLRNVPGHGAETAARRLPPTPHRQQPHQPRRRTYDGDGGRLPSPSCG